MGFRCPTPTTPSVLDCVQLRVGVCAAFAHLANERASSVAGLR